MAPPHEPYEPPLGVPLLLVTRGSGVESVHRGSVAVVDEHGSLVASAGDPLLAVFLRSAAKPFQLVPFLADGGQTRFRLTTRDVALATASHAGEPFHVERARRMLARGGFGVSDLRCGAHAPMGEAAARELAARGEKPSPLHNNCSGKHAAMLLGCRMWGLDPATYTEPEHPLQRRILSYLARATDVPEERIGLAVDGCSVPVFRIPLRHAALGYARLMGRKRADETAAERGARARIVSAFFRAPEMVAGTGRFTTELIRILGGEVLGKEGAEGVYAMAVRRDATPGAAGGSIGIALKIEDGAERARAAVVVEVLRQLGLARGARLAALGRIAKRTVRNVRGVVVGRLEPVFSLDLHLSAGAER